MRLTMAYAMLIQFTQLFLSFFDSLEMENDKYTVHKH